MGETGQSRRIKEIFIISGIYKEGDVIYLDTPTKTGFLFVRWEVVSGDSVIENDNKLTVGEL